MMRSYFWLSDDRFAQIALHLPTDTRGKPPADALLDQMPDTSTLKGGTKAMIATPFARSEAKGATPNIPPKEITRRRKNCFSHRLHQDRNAI